MSVSGSMKVCLHVCFTSVKVLGYSSVLPVCERACVRMDKCVSESICSVETDLVPSPCRFPLLALCPQSAWPASWDNSAWSPGRSLPLSELTFLF